MISLWIFICYTFIGINKIFNCIIFLVIRTVHILCQVQSSDHFVSLILSSLIHFFIVSDGFVIVSLIGLYSKRKLFVKIRSYLII